MHLTVCDVSTGVTVQDEYKHRRKRFVIKRLIVIPSQSF